MKPDTDIKVLELLAVVNLDITIWTARKKLTQLDLGGAELPPDDLASLGSKRICDPVELRSFGTLKARAVSLLERHGIRFLGGWAVPDSRLTDITAELTITRDEFNAAKEAFLLRYDRSVQDWIARHPQWGGIISNSTVNAEYVRSRLDFRWQAFKVVSPESDSPANDSLREDVSGLGDTLFGEIARAASETWQRCYAGKTEVTRKALSPLKTILAKLHGLTFVEPRVSPAADLVTTALKSIPKRGAITGPNLVMLQGLVSLLRCPQDLIQHGQMILDGRRQAVDVLSGFVQADGFGGLPEISPCPQNDNDTSPDIEDDLAEEMPVPETIPAQPLIDSMGLW